MKERLYKSRDNKVFAGIVGGIGEYLNVDPVVLRVACIFLFAISGFAPGIIGYIVSIFIVPKKPL